jgi:hypothetical protein
MIHQPSFSITAPTNISRFFLVLLLLFGISSIRFGEQGTRETQHGVYAASAAALVGASNSRSISMLKLATAPQGSKKQSRPEPCQVTDALLELRANSSTVSPTLSTLTAHPWRPVFVASAAAAIKQETTSDTGKNTLDEKNVGKYYKGGDGGRKQVFKATAKKDDLDDPTTGTFASTFATLVFRMIQFTVKGDFVMLEQPAGGGRY